MIDISGFVGEELRLLKERQIKSGIIQSFVCSTNGNVLSPSHLSKQLQSFQDAHKLPHCRFHDLRHTFAMLQVENGTDLDTLKRLLGHSKIGVTSDMYLHPNLLLIKKASAKLDNIVQLNCAEIVQKSKKGSTG